MRYSPEKLIRHTEFKLALCVGAFEMAKMAGQIWRLQALSTGTDFDSINPAINFILDNTGDFAATYLGTWALKDFIPGQSDKKLNLASAITIGSALAVETLPLFGTPRAEDLPAAFIGILAYRGINRLLRKNIK